MVAAAAPPANPVPTTITVYFRLFAGFTSFISNLHLLHLSWIGPAGVFESNGILLVTRKVPVDTCDNGKWNRNIPQHNKDGAHQCEQTETRSVLRVIPANRLEHAPHAMIEMQSEKRHRGEIQDHCQRLSKPR